jgi:hypothetical protein
MKRVLFAVLIVMCFASGLALGSKPKSDYLTMCRQWTSSPDGSYVCRWLGYPSYFYDAREIDQKISELQRSIADLERRVQALEQNQ